MANKAIWTVWECSQSLTRTRCFSLYSPNLTGSTEITTEYSHRVRWLVNSFGQDIYGVTGGRQKPPKQMLLPYTVKTLTNDVELIQMLTDVGMRSRFLKLQGQDKVEQNIVMSVASRSITCRSRRLRQIIDMRDTFKSRYFAITEYNNCFIIRSPTLFSYFNQFLTAQGSDLPFFPRERGSNYACAEYYL